MTADVYADDDALRDGVPSASQHAFEYRVTADPDPDALCRIANQMLFANVAPWRLELIRDRAGHVCVTVELRGVVPSVAESIRRKLLQLTCVLDVEFRAFEP
ncbi:MAG TPA: hypothetical protein VLT59_18155 [Steroidobacteraceae bacterium]|nr:hypothetical protein [Steroidobacteraceae bacterium]